MKQLLLIFIGGGTGSILRYAISKLLRNSINIIPYGTLVVNCLGSLLIGLLIGYSLKTQNLSSNQLAFLVIGLCGGFTTFYTFSYDNTLFLKSGDFLLYRLLYCLFSFRDWFCGPWILAGQIPFNASLF